MIDENDSPDFEPLEPTAPPTEQEAQSAGGGFVQQHELSAIETVDSFDPIESSLAPPSPSGDSSLAGEAALSPDDSMEPAAPPLDGYGGTPLEPAQPPLEAIKNFSEQLTGSKVIVPAALPFSVLIEGELTKDEKDKLLDILSREKMGISAVDIEPQLEGNRILIPRISEYAAVLLVQALRDTQARLRTAPSDQVFATEDTHTAADERTPSAATEKRTSQVRSDLGHPSDLILITSGSSLPEVSDYSVIGVLTATAALKTTLVEAAGSAEYQEAVEALQRELRYKAWYKHAIAILNFSVQLTTLQFPSQYRLTVSGTAIKAPAARA